MKLSETAELLFTVSGLDNRELDDLRCAAWHAILVNVDYEDAKLAVAAHFSGPNRHEYFTSNHVLDYVEAKAAKNREVIDATTLPEYLAQPLPNAADFPTLQLTIDPNRSGAFHLHHVTLGDENGMGAMTVLGDDAVDEIQAMRQRKRDEGEA